MLVDAVVVADHVQLDPGVGAGDLLEEGQELDVGVALEATLGPPARWRPPRTRYPGTELVLRYEVKTRP